MEPPLEIPDPDNTVARQLSDVVHALADRDSDRARRAMEPLAGVTCRSHPIAPMPTLPRDTWPAADGTGTRNPPIPVIARTFIRDGFTCGYCSRWTIPPQVLRLVSHAFPEAFPYHPNWPMATTPRAYWDISTSIDHIHAVSTGGDWQSPSNLITACARCQYQKSNLSLSALGWSIRRGFPSWDGLTDAYPQLWRALDEPDPRHHRAWIRAFDGAARV